ncbi:MAG TPA: hypothetical protein ENJ79_06155 [Gammaproteobacteria bacterium]|nr:hypothetical protein [Gammaproteobacteria bacterium]
MLKHKTRRGGSLAALLLAAPPALALETDVGVALKVEYSDNIGLTARDEQEEWQRGGLFGFSLVEETPVVSADVRALAEYRNFRNNTFSDDWRGDGSVSLAWHMLPQRLSWEVEDYFVTLLQDTQAPDTPGNQINTNVFSTGPLANIRFSATHRAELGARYSRFSYEDRASDSDRMRGLASYFRRLRPAVEASLNGMVENVQFDQDALVPDYLRGDLFLGASSGNPLNTWTVNAGLSYIDRERQKDVDGFLARAVWRRYFRATSYVDINAYAQYTDTGLNLLTAGGQQRILTTASEQVSGDLFYDKRAEFIYHLGLGQSSIDASFQLREEDYETQPLDRETIGGRLSYSMNRSTALTSSVYVQYLRYDYTDDDRTDDDVRAGLSLNYRFSRSLSLVGRYNFNYRDSTRPVSDYRENRIMFYVFYGRDPFTYRVSPF